MSRLTFRTLCPAVLNSRYFDKNILSHLPSVKSIILVIFCVLSVGFIFAQQPGKISSELSSAIASSDSPQEKFHIIIVMSARYTFAPYTVSVKEQRDYIYKKRLEELKTFSASDQKDIMEFLEKEKSAGNISGEIKSNYVKNLIALFASAELIKNKIALRDDVSFILPYDDKTFSDESITDSQLNILDYSRDYQSALARLNDANPLARRAAISYIGRLKEPSSVKPLLNALSDEDPLVRRTACEALVNFTGNRQVEAAVVELLKKESDVSVKISAIRTAGQIGSGIFQETLRVLASDQFAIYRAEAIKSLAKIRPISETSRRIIIKAILDEAEGVRISAMEASWRNAFAEALPFVISNLSDPVALVRRSACEALGHLGTKEEHISLLEKIALNDADNTVRVEAANSAELIRSRLKVPRR